jgi:hypothetical protein
LWHGTWMVKRGRGELGNSCEMLVSMVKSTDMKNIRAAKLVDLRKARLAINAEVELRRVEARYYYGTRCEGLVLRFSKRFNLFYQPVIDGDQISSAPFRGQLTDVSKVDPWPAVLGARLVRCFQMVNDYELTDAVQLQFQQPQNGIVVAIQIESWTYLEAFRMTFSPKHEPLTFDPAWLSQLE